MCNPPTKEEYIAINDDGKIIEDIEKLLDDIKRSRISVVTKLVQTEGIQSYIISNANLNEAMCMCGESMQTYKKKQCDKLNKHSEIKKIEECAKLYRLLDGKNTQCLCPVDPNGDRTCGIPLNLDLRQTLVVQIPVLWYWFKSQVLRNKEVGQYLYKTMVKMMTLDI